MRLHKLAMSYIGPYAGAVSIDFTELGEVFLVCGKTGSGKSTIFDAIAYALYGSEHITRDIVSHHAGPDNESYVELEFEAGRERWRISRKPARTAAKKRGTGTTDRPAEVALWKRIGSNWKALSDKATEVESTIQGVIGLSSEEFTKIVLLPQGEFQRFLEMNTRERTLILEKLFPVDLHGAVSDLAREKAREAEARARDLAERIRSMESRLGSDPAADAGKAREHLAQARMDEAEALSVLDKAKASVQAALVAARAFAELDAARLASQALETGAGEAASLAARLERAEAAAAARPAVDTARHAGAEHAEATRAVNADDEALAVLDIRLPQIEAARSTLVELAASLASMDNEAGRLSAQAAAWERASAAQARLTESRTRLAAAESARMQASERHAEAVSALAALAGTDVDTDALSKERADAAEALDMARARMRQAREAESRMQEIAGLRERLEAERVRAAEAGRIQTAAASNLERTETAAEAARSHSLALHLAMKLVAGQSCPVCGSTEHPSPASSGAGTGVEELEALELAVETARTEARTADQNAAASAARLGELDRIVAGKEADSSVLADAPSSLTAIPELDAAGIRMALADKALTAEAGRQKSAAAARDTVDRQRELLDAATASEAIARAEFAAAEASASEAGSGSGGSDPAPLVAALEQRKKTAHADKSNLEAMILSWERDRGAAAAQAVEAHRRLERAREVLAGVRATMAKALADAGFDCEEAWSAAAMTNSELAAARSAVRERAEAVSSAGATLAAAERAVAGIARPDAAACEAALDDATGRYNAARAALDETVRVERELSAAIAALEAERAGQALRRERGEALVAMAKLLNGDTDGRRLSFKNFALGSYFAAVVDHASQRLREMSDSRYDMRVTEGRISGRGRVGLDLEVLDAFTGVARPASSLSGGEKFLASISLALGLSDVIVARSGGISLDSIFIDEGFGSLDDETLDRAMTALDRVRGDRVIGIVSHVADLRGRVPARIEVLKSSAGSSLRVVQ
jgi:exonuclease SbcC